MGIKRWMSVNSIGNEILIRPFWDFPFPRDSQSLPLGDV